MDEKILPGTLVEVVGNYSKSVGARLFVIGHVRSRAPLGEIWYELAVQPEGEKVLEVRADQVVVVEVALFIRDEQIERVATALADACWSINENRTDDRDMAAAYTNAWERARVNRWSFHASRKSGFQAMIKLAIQSTPTEDTAHD